MQNKTWVSFKEHSTQADKYRDKTTATESGYTSKAATKFDIQNVVRETIQQELRKPLFQELGQGSLPPQSMF